MEYVNFVIVLCPQGHLTPIFKPPVTQYISVPYFQAVIQCMRVPFFQAVNQ
jgi:hypothetical protein